MVALQQMYFEDNEGNSVDVVYHFRHHIKCEIRSDYWKIKQNTVNSSGPSDAIWLISDGTKPLPEPILTYHQ